MATFVTVKDKTTGLWVRINFYFITAYTPGTEENTTEIMHRDGDMSILDVNSKDLDLVILPNDKLRPVSDKFDAALHNANSNL